MNYALIVVLWSVAHFARVDRVEGVVSRVQDGDSFIAETPRGLLPIRLWGIDAPELRQPGGRYALEVLRARIRGRRVSIEIMDTDRWKRLICKVYVAGAYVNGGMVEEGAAWWYRRYAPDDVDLVDAEETARKKKVGIWKNTDNINPEQWRRGRR